MSLNSMNQFKESQLGSNFSPENLKNFKELIESSISFVVLSMPGVGVSYFLKYLASQDFARFDREARRTEFIHIDLYSMPSLNQHEFYKLVLKEFGADVKEESDEKLFEEIKHLLVKFCQKRDKVVLIFSHFDQLKKDFDWNFLSNLQSLSSLAPGKICQIFTSIKPLEEIAPEAVSGGNLNFFSKDLYFKPYSPDDLKKLLDLEPKQQISHEDLTRLIKLSGGHNQLLHIFLNSQKQQNLLLDRFVSHQLKELYEYLDYSQRKQVQNIALRSAQGKPSFEIDEYLLGVGMVIPDEKSFKLFTPLLQDYIKTNLPHKLPVKERILFKLLQNNMGKVVGKDEIFSTLWVDNPEKGTDWALDALIYRLRKSSFMKANGYIIESYKKVGYTLIKI